MAIDKNNAFLKRRCSWVNIDLSNWQKLEQKKLVISSKEELVDYMFNKIMYKRDEMSEEEKAKMMATIRQKIKNGKILTPEEERLLQQTDPMLYQQYLRIRAMANGLKEKLKHAKTKQEANDMITSSIASVSEKDPYKECIIAALNEVAKEFKRSQGYARLPNNDSELHRKRVNPNHVLDENFDGEEDDDLMSWTPIQEIIDAMPKFHMKA